jgi:BCD family chlorophyll transporter-like MFS transporter
MGADAPAFGLVFILEAGLFLASAIIASRIGAPASSAVSPLPGARHVQA